MKRTMYSNIGRNFVWVTGLVTVMQLMTLQPAHADVNWVNDIFQPMMNQVIGPAVEKRIDAWQAKHDKTGSTQTLNVQPQIPQAMPTSATTTTTTPSTVSTTVPASSPASAAPASAIPWDAYFN